MYSEEGPRVENPICERVFLSRATSSSPRLLTVEPLCLRLRGLPPSARTRARPPAASLSLRSGSHGLGHDPRRLSDRRLAPARLRLRRTLTAPAARRGARLGRAGDPKPPRPTPKATVTASIPLIHGQDLCTPHSDTDSGIMPRQQGCQGNPHGPWWQHELPELFRWGALIAATGVAHTCVCSWTVSSQPVRACPVCSRSRSAYRWLARSE
jgi:hypothetical protein